MRYRTFSQRIKFFQEEGLLQKLPRYWFRVKITMAVVPTQVVTENLHCNTLDLMLYDHLSLPLSWHLLLNIYNDCYKVVHYPV